MKTKKLNKKQLSAIIVPSVALGVAGISTGIYFIANKVQNDSTIKYFNEVVNKINDFNLKTNNDFIKGADVSSYAGIVENLLFNNNIKKDDGSWYTYKDIENTNIKVENKKTRTLVTLEEYINNNLYSYFDENSNRVYENMFSILRKKGINSLRLRFWVDPYDENGNSYGGGHNDLDTNIFIMKQAKKYGFDDFLINFHYSDFWADPGKHYMPKSWENKTNEELLQTSYEYTTDVLNKIYDEVGIIPKRVQYGNEINRGFLDSYDENNKTISKSFDFLNDFIIKGVEATNDFQKNHPETKIDKIIHVEGYDSIQNVRRFGKAARYCDSIHLSFYLQYAYQINVLPKEFEIIRKEFPNQKLYMGEVTYMYSSHGYENINQSGITADDISNSNWDSEFQALTMFQNMQLLSKLLPDIETGFYWWEIGELYLGRFSWSTKEGFSYYRDWDYKERNYQDSNDWSSSTCFDKNGIALPVLDVINNFERNPNLSEYYVYDTNKYFNTDKYGNLFETDLKYFIGKIDFLWPKNFTKKDLSKLFINKLDKSAENMDIDLEIYLNNENININESFVIQKVKDEYTSLMYNQIDFSNFSYNSETNIGEIKLTANNKSFYYKENSEITLKFKVFPKYLSDTVDLSSDIIDISKNDNSWYKTIISKLKSQPNYAFGNQIWKYLNISGGGTDDNNIWLYDENKGVNRDAEFFLLNSDEVRKTNNKIDFDVLQKQKIWVNNFENYDIGNHDIFFAVRKAIHGIDWKNDTQSTYSQVGAESWKYTDILIYKLKINVK